MGSFLLCDNLTPFASDDFHNFLIGFHMPVQDMQDFSKGEKYDGVKFIFQTAVVSCPNFSRNFWSVFIYLLSYREKEKMLICKVPAHSFSNNGKMTHVMGNHHGQHTEEGCRSRHNGLAGKVMSFTYKNEGLLTLLLSWPWSTSSTYPVYFNVLQSKSICWAFSAWV